MFVSLTGEKNTGYEIRVEGQLQTTLGGIASSASVVLEMPTPMVEMLKPGLSTFTPHS
jgi:hypothetical protein